MSTYKFSADFYMKRTGAILSKAHQSALRAAADRSRMHMSTQRTKGRPKSRHAPNARSRQRRQPIRGRYPVLPPIGDGASWCNDPYQLTGQPPLMIPAMAYPVVPFHHQVLSPSTMPVNAFPHIPQPYAAAMSTVPTSTLVYYTPPFPAVPYQWMWTEPNSMITELATDLENDEGSGSCSDEDESTHFIQQGMLHPDTAVCSSKKVSMSKQ